MNEHTYLPKKMFSDLWTSKNYEEKYFSFVKTNGILSCWLLLWPERSSHSKFDGKKLPDYPHSVIGRSNNQIQKSTAGIFRAATKKRWETVWLRGKKEKHVIVPSHNGANANMEKYYIAITIKITRSSAIIWGFKT